jgi:hypothetical protein
MEERYWTIKHLLGDKDAKILMGNNDRPFSTLSECQVAIRTIEKRIRDNLSPIDEALQTAVMVAGDVDVANIANRLPHQKEDWMRLLRKAVNEIKCTKMIRDPATIDAIVRAFHVQDSPDDSWTFLRDLSLNGIRIPSSVLVTNFDSSETEVRQNPNQLLGGNRS